MQEREINEKYIDYFKLTKKKGNSQILCEQFKKGAEAKGHQAKIVRIMEQNIGFCTTISGVRAMEEALEQIGQGMKAVPMAEADVASRLQKVLQKPVVGRLKWRRWQICLQ